MALRRIAQIGHPVLRRRADELTPDALAAPEIQRLIDDMIETMRDVGGAGIAAPQVYESLRICVVEVKNNPRYPYKPEIPLTVLVNPEIRATGDELFDQYEGCLSVPELRGLVPRHALIDVRALDRQGRPVSFAARGFTAGVYQHEVDHLDGRLFLDRVADPASLTTLREYERHHLPAYLAYAESVVARYGP